MPLHPKLATWEMMIDFARTVSRKPTPHACMILAAALVEHHTQIVTGQRKLPASWQSGAVHLAGYEKDVVPR